jgi:hypothetical protein
MLDKNEIWWSSSWLSQKLRPYSWLTFLFRNLLFLCWINYVDKFNSPLNSIIYLPLQEGGYISTLLGGLKEERKKKKEKLATKLQIMPQLCPPPPLVHSIYGIHPKLRWDTNRVILLRIFFHIYIYEVLELLNLFIIIWSTNISSPTIKIN